MNFMPRNRIGFCTLSIIEDREDGPRTVYVSVDGPYDYLRTTRQAVTRMAAPDTFWESGGTPGRETWEGTLQTTWSPRQVIDSFLTVFDDGMEVMNFDECTVYSFWLLPRKGPEGSGHAGGTHER
jgi:hypothetical protein